MTQWVGVECGELAAPVVATALQHLRVGTTCARISEGMPLQAYVIVDFTFTNPSKCGVPNAAIDNTQTLATLSHQAMCSQRFGRVPASCAGALPVPDTDGAWFGDTSNNLRCNAWYSRRLSPESCVSA